MISGHGCDVKNTGISIGIVGCGTVTQVNYVKAFAKLPMMRVYCVHDLNDNAARRAAKLLSAKAVSFRDLVANVDVVIVATPPSTHFDIIKDCINAGKTTVSEKPFVGKASEARILHDLAQSVNMNLFVAHFRRCFPSVQLSRQLIGSGALGKVASIDVAEGGRFSWESESGYVYRDIFGGVLYDTGSHAIDMALCAAGLDDLDIVVRVGSVKRDKEEPSHALDAALTLSSGGRDVSARVRLSRFAALANRIRITLEHAVVEMPVGLANQIRVTGRHGSTIVYARDSYSDLFDCFALQYQTMLVGPGKELFEARRFLGLTTILENIGSHKGEVGI